MASRISHKSRLNSFSLSRLMVTRASGSAIAVRTIRITVAMINSRSVKPRSDLALRPLWNLHTFMVASSFHSRLTECTPPFLLDGQWASTGRSLDGHRRLRPVHGDGLQSGIARSAPRDRKRSLSARLRLESYGDHRAVSVNSTLSRRPRGRNLQRAGSFVFAMHQRNRLSILREEATVRHIHQLQLGGIVVHLHPHRINILRPGNQQLVNVSNGGFKIGRAHV